LRSICEQFLSLLYLDEAVERDDDAEMNEDVGDVEIDGVGDVEIDGAVEVEEVADENNRLRRRQLTKNRLVNSIDAALNLDNYNPYQIPEDLQSINSNFKVDNKTTIVREFQNKPTTGNIGQRNRANVITGRQGTQPKAKDTPTARAAFQLFFTEEMMGTIVLCTNRKIAKCIANLPEGFLEQSNKYPFIKETTVEELYAVIGLYLYRGLFKQNTIAVERLFSNVYGPPIYSATMSRSRFTFIRANLSFDDEATRDARWKQDRFAAMRDIFEAFNYECMSCLIPGDFLSLDETLYPMRTQISFKMYNPNKPAKYGLLLKAINAARYPYTFVAAPYCGKPQEDGGAYYVQGTEGIVMYMIDQLMAVVPLAGRNISFDRLYTSITIQLWLYAKHITSLGTMMMNRKGVPLEFKNFKHREHLSTQIYWQKDGPLSLSSYVVKTASSGKKNVLILSTLDPILGTTKDDKCHKLGLYKLYDFTKGGTDIVDQRMGFHTTKTKSRKWTSVMFCYMLDTARVNASTIFALNKGVDPLKQDSFEFCYELVMQFVKPVIQRRPVNGLQSIVQQKIILTMGPAVVAEAQPANVYPTFAEKRKKCIKCLQDIKGENYSKNKNSVPIIRTICQTCGTPTCQKHLTAKCGSCSK
jgi:hypothetical protein